MIVTLTRQQRIPTEIKCRLIHLFQKALLYDIVTGRKAHLEKAVHDAALLNSKLVIDIIIFII
jgi:hypothetical protein